jgi:hypothetical protein
MMMISYSNEKETPSPQRISNNEFQLKRELTNIHKLAMFFF